MLIAESFLFVSFFPSLSIWHLAAYMHDFSASSGSLVYLSLVLYFYFAFYFILSSCNIHVAS